MLSRIHFRFCRCQIRTKERKEKRFYCRWSLRSPLDHGITVSDLNFLSQKSLACGFGVEESLTLHRKHFERKQKGISLKWMGGRFLALI
ncbi:hypothetical protein OIU84_007701 [Salix udensis]|uniref:Uncharacterized protein n=1 Tax=Salix udensis TaxID=889485 RepID=A0AAD6NZP3_9ROSI|nr:hypothetical protein OIU84_007701 [Salix udensis]